MLMTTLRDTANTWSSSCDCTTCLSAFLRTIAYETLDGFRSTPAHYLRVLACEERRANEELLDLLPEPLRQVRCAVDGIHPLMPEGSEDQSRV